MVYLKAISLSVPSIFVLLVGCGGTVSILTDADANADDPDTPPLECPVGYAALILGGEFVMGSDSGEGSDDEETPERIIYVSAFCMQTTEVTTGEYRACVDSMACELPRDASSRTRDAYYTDPAYNEYPVVNVDWYQASAYCEWSGGRLPTEAEWEKAARGGCESHGDGSVCEDPEDEPRFPWGDVDSDCTLVNFCESGPLDLSVCCVGDTQEAGVLMLGVSVYGVLDMSGNVAEWVNDWYQDDWYSRSSDLDDPVGPSTGVYKVLRGGGWNSPIGGHRNSNRGQATPDHWHDMVGFRCVYDIE